jgi:putative phage-type endonuclease
MKTIFDNTNEIPRDDWLVERKKYICSTDSPAICGISKYKSAVQVYNEKTAENGFDDDGIVSPAARDGRALESFLREKFQRETGLLINDCAIMGNHDEHEFLAANFDCVLVDSPVPVELKAVGSWAWKEWETAVPLYYQAQVQHQIAVMDAPHAYIIGWSFGRDPVIEKIERDDEAISVIVDKCAYFWKNHVVPRVPPVLDENATSDNIRALFPKSNQGQIALPDSASVWLEQWDAAKDLEVKALQLKEESKRRLMAMMEDHESGTLGDRTITWKSHERSSFDSKRFKTEHPDQFESFKKTSTVRTFKVK